MHCIKIQQVRQLLTMKYRLKPIQGHSITKTEANFQFHMLQFMSQVVKQQRQTNNLLRMMLNKENISTDSLPQKKNVEQSSYKKRTIQSQNLISPLQLQAKNPLMVVNQAQSNIKFDLIMNAFSDTINKTQQTNQQILNQLKIMNKQALDSDFLIKSSGIIPSRLQISEKNLQIQQQKAKISTHKHYSRLQQIKPYIDRREAKVKIDFAKIIEQYNKSKTSKQILQKSIKEWLGIVYRVTASISWNMLQAQLLNYNETKIFFTENIIFNYIELMKEVRKVYVEQMNNKQKKQLATYIINKQAAEILKFLCTQYPMTKIQAPNMAIRSTIQLIDERGDIKYDTITNSKILFKYNRRKQYAPEIMKFINYLIDMVDEKYSHFQQFFWKLFDSIHYPTEIRKWPWEQQQIENNLQYISKVKKYTKFAIGRKISKNIVKYTDEDIYNGVFFLKSSAIGRVIFKWIEELLEIIKDPKKNIQQRYHSFKTHEGKQLMLDYPVRHGIYMAIEKNKQQLFDRLAVIQKDSFEIQGNLTEEEYVSHQNLDHLSQQQINVGFFSSNLKDALSSYLFMQLYEIINFLLKIPLEINVNNLGIQGYHFRKKASKDLKNVNLVSFNIYDLFRCKCSSGQNQIIYLINLLKKLHFDEKDSFQLVRIKDRLNLGTRDILINAQFGSGQPVFEIQLSVASQVDIKQDLLDQYNHFLYELRRSKILGPLIQNVSIWTSLQQRALYFNQLAQYRFQNAINRPHQHTCQKPRTNTFVGPIVCATCQTFYDIPRSCLPNQICQNCKQIICGQCWYLGLSKLERKKFIFGEKFDNALFDHITQYQNIQNVKTFPKYALFVKKPFLRAELSFLHHYPSTPETKEQITQVVFRKEANKVILRGFLSQVDASKKDKISNFIVFEIDNQFIQFRTLSEIREIIENNSSTRIISLLQQPNYARDIKCYDSSNKKAQTELIQKYEEIIATFKLRGIDEKITIFRNKDANLIILGQFNYPREIISQKLTKRANMHILKKLCRQNCTIISLQHKKVMKQLNKTPLLQNVGEKKYQFLCLNLKKLFLNFNEIESIEDLKYMTKIEVLALNHNQLDSLRGIEQMRNLIQISFDKNRIKSLKPLENLLKLKIIKGNENQIESLQGTQNLTQLQNLQIYKNKIETVKNFTQNWRSLIHLYLRNNELNQFAVFNGLERLQDLSLSKNPIIQIHSLAFMKSLKSLSLTNINLQQLPIKQIKGLQLFQLSCHKNKIKSMKGLSTIKTLKFIGLDNNEIQVIQDIQDLRLQRLLLANNKIKIVKGLQNSFETLQQLTLDQNPLEQCQKFPITYTPQIVSQRVSKIMKEYLNNEYDILQYINRYK